MKKLEEKWRQLASQGPVPFLLSPAERVDEVRPDLPAPFVTFKLEPECWRSWVLKIVYETPCWGWGWLSKFWKSIESSERPSDRLVLVLQEGNIWWASFMVSYGLYSTEKVLILTGESFTANKNQNVVPSSDHLATTSFGVSCKLWPCWMKRGFSSMRQWLTKNMRLSCMTAVAVNLGREPLQGGGLNDVEWNGIWINTT